MRLHPSPRSAALFPRVAAFPGGVVGACTEPESPTARAVRRWVSRRLGGVRHEQRVAAVATHLFDLTRPLHRLAPADRRLLRLAALVHDVGRSIAKSGHPKKGARLLLADDTLPLTRGDRRALAYLALRHRGRVPDPARDPALRRRDDADRLRRLLALLRAADALDSRSLAPAGLTFAVTPSLRHPGRRTLRVTCHLPTDSAKARRVYSRRKKFRLLEELLGVRVRVRVDVAVRRGAAEVRRAAA